LLELREVESGYGRSRVLFGVSLEVGAGEVVCLLGRNGVGKTTTLRTVIGQLTPTGGTIRFRGEDITGVAPHRIAKLGLAYVPADRRCFSGLTVEENLQVGAKVGPDGADHWTQDRVYELFPDLQRLSNLRAAHLSGGQQQMLTIGRALMGNPVMLLLDEPAEGLAPVILETLESQVAMLTADGLTILLAEMNVGFALSLGQRAYILDKGEIRYEGAVEDLREDQELMHEHLAV
jgi:branched-chain amino acid transport system ATP-binding protein